jgi:hypothetical protein
MLQYKNFKNFVLTWIMYCVQTNVFFADGKVISKEKEKSKNLHFIFLGCTFDKFHKPHVPPCLRHLTHKRGTHDQNICIFHLNFEHLQYML